MSVLAGARERLLRVACRAVAIGVALLAAIDPAITTTRIAQPLISVVAADRTRDRALVEQVERSLRTDARVSTAPIANADATILVGEQLPISSRAIAVPAYVVRREPVLGSVAIVAVRAPNSSSIHARARIGATLRVPGSAGANATRATLELSLFADGVLVDRTTIPLGNRARLLDTLVNAELDFVPSTATLARLRVNARLVGGAAVASADLLLDVHDRPMSVLVYDPRPSWMSTFARRALERDPRFAVSSRIVTSRNISSVTGAAPERLDALTSLDPFDAIVVGAPDAISARDVAGLERYLRRRGGAVVLLLDTRSTGAIDRLTTVRNWSFRNDPNGVLVRPVGGDTSALRTSQQLWPALLPIGAQVVARSDTSRDAQPDRGPDRARDRARDRAPEVVSDRALIWSIGVGAGELVVSGALDAWRFRDRAVSGFERVWPSIIADAASASLPPVSVQLAQQVLAPGDDANFTVLVRQPALSSSARNVSTGVSGTDARLPRTRVSAVLETANDSLPRIAIRLWPDGAIGLLRGTLRAPILNGPARLVVTADGQRTIVPIVVDSTRQRVSESDAALLEAWATSRGGRAITPAELPSLVREIRRSIQAAPRAVSWHPMRSGWWLIPFVLALSGEWWLRRRRSLA